jgi:hypothetical protein
MELHAELLDSSAIKLSRGDRDGVASARELCAEREARMQIAERAHRGE